MSQEDELSTFQVDTKDSKTSKLETIINQARVGFYTLLAGTVVSFGYGIFSNNSEAMAIGQQLLTPVVGWMFMYVAILVNKKDGN